MPARIETEDNTEHGKDFVFCRSGGAVYHLDIVALATEPGGSCGLICPWRRVPVCLAAFCGAVL